ncbi:MAG: hypothetical protein D6682_00095 [Zetaproteobacteria bacterium]|nr:MAG: hypothetical protein D6682_00095 [Zetaproteobacteria bacterium]
MKVVRRNSVQSGSVTRKRRRSGTEKDAFASVMHEQQATGGVDRREEGRDRADAASEQAPRERDDHPEVLLMLVRQGIDVLDDGLAQIEREGIGNTLELREKLDAVGSRLHAIRSTQGGSPLLDTSETIINVESERLRRLA